MISLHPSHDMPYTHYYQHNEVYMHEVERLGAKRDELGIVRERLIIALLVGALMIDALTYDQNIYARVSIYLARCVSMHLANSSSALDGQRRLTAPMAAAAAAAAAATAGVRVRARVRHGTPIPRV